NLAQKFEAFAPKISPQNRQAGNITTRPRQPDGDPSGKRVSHRRSDNWDYRGRLFCGNGGWSSPGHDDTDLKVDKLGRNLGQTLVVPLRPPILDDDVAAVDPAELAKPLHESGDPLALGRTRARTQEPDSIRRLLRARRERPRRSRAADRGYKFSPFDRDWHRPLPCEGGQAN